VPPRAIGWLMRPSSPRRASGGIHPKRGLRHPSVAARWLTSVLGACAVRFSDVVLSSAEGSISRRHLPVCDPAHPTCVRLVTGRAIVGTPARGRQEERLIEIRTLERNTDSALLKPKKPGEPVHLYQFRLNTCKSPYSVAVHHNPIITKRPTDRGKKMVAMSTITITSELVAEAEAAQILRVEERASLTSKAKSTGRTGASKLCPIAKAEQTGWQSGQTGQESR
jgi:hypothetical protein